MTLQHGGILLVVLGTIFLAFSVKVKRQYIGEIAKYIDQEKKKDSSLLENTETKIDRRLFWAGLICVAIGTLMQW